VSDVESLRGIWECVGHQRTLDSIEAYRPGTRGCQKSTEQLYQTTATYTCWSELIRIVVESMSDLYACGLLRWS
ncbi:hypothetical protein COCCADRAFT_113526, partial [Bipolaris zeicola 26-R-13]